MEWKMIIVGYSFIHSFAFDPFIMKSISEVEIGPFIPNLFYDNVF